MKKICIVEDNESINELVVYALQAQNYEVFGFESSKGFWELVCKERIDLIILDVMLPEEDGISILKKIRSDKKLENIPVIMLTAKSSEVDILKGFNYGADDYIVKPFSVLELVARVKVFLKRSNISEENYISEVVEYKNIKIDIDKRIVYVDNNIVELTFKEYELLNILLKNEEIVLSREELLKEIWGYDYEGETRTVDMHIKTLRKKLGDSINYIKTVRGIGYKIGD